MYTSAKFFLTTLPHVLALCIGLALMTGDVRGAPDDHSLQQAKVPVGAGTHPSTKFQVEFAPSARWLAPVRWKYNHDKAPPELAGFKSAIIAQLQASFDKWSSQCAVAHQYDGETTTAPNTLVPAATYGNQPDGSSVVGWDALAPAYGAWTYVWFEMAGAQRALIDADVVLNPANVRTLAELDRLMTHEWGHVLGLSHSNLQSAVMAGPPLTNYSPLVTPQADDIRGCRCLYGLLTGVQSSLVCSLPPVVDFGDAAIGRTSVPKSVTFTNSGNAPLSIYTSDVLHPAQFQRVNGCGPGTVVGPGQSCSVALAATPVNTGVAASELVLFTSEGYYELPLTANGIDPGAVAAGTATVDVVEFYNPALDHYFITWTAAEIANLDAGTTSPRWVRTGKTFKAFTSAQNGTSQVCRFYIPPALGNSHFFGRGAAECAATRTAHPEFVLEEINYKQLFVPDRGTCPAGSKAVYRVFNNRPATNHRYTIERAVRDEMVGKGWVAEGDGDDMVVMCAP